MISIAIRCFIPGNDGYSFYVFHTRSPLFLSILIYYDKIKQNQTKHQFSSPQLRHVPSGTSGCPRPHLAGSFSSPSHASLWIDLPHSLLPAPAPTTAAEPREGDPGGADGRSGAGGAKNPKNQSGPTRRSASLWPPRLRPGASLARFCLANVCGSPAVEAGNFPSVGMTSTLLERVSGTPSISAFGCSRKVWLF